MHNGGLVKTIRFSEPKYVGDPINSVRIFNEKEVDELMILDIDATVRRNPPNFALIARLAAECRMPLCYGGGVQTVADVERLIGLGVEKVAFCGAAVSNPGLINEVSSRVGSQSVVVVLDVKRVGVAGRAEVVVDNGLRSTGLVPSEFARTVANAGAGEIVVNSVDRDGLMNGYDLDLIRSVREAVSVPITALGGAGSLDDMKNLVTQFGVIGAAAGSLFVFKGRFRAVLINYPNPKEKLALFSCPTR